MNFNSVYHLLNTVKKHFRKLWNKGALLVIGGNFATKFISFFGSIFYVRLLSKRDYGIASYAENIYGYVILFSGLGLGNGLIRYVVLKDALSEKYGIYRFVIRRGSWINIGVVLLGCLYCLFYPHALDYAPYRYLYAIMLIGVFFQYFLDEGLLTSRAMFDNSNFALLTIISSTVLILSRILGAWLFDLNGAIMGRVFAEMLLGIGCLCYIPKLYYRNTAPVLPDKKERSEIHKYSFQYMVTNGLWAVFMLNDIFLLGRLCSDATVLADYKVAYAIPGALSLFSSAIGVFVGPYFTKHEQDREWVFANYKKTLLITAGIIGFAAMCAAILGKPAIIFLYGEEYVTALPIMRVLLLAAFCNCGLRFTTANTLAATGHIKYNMLIVICTVFAQIAINMMIIPKYGGLGVAWVSAALYFIMALSLFVCFYRIYGNNHRLYAKK